MLKMYNLVKNLKHMRKIVSAVLFVSLLITSSCSSDDSEESFGTSTGNYWPMAVNNTWTFDDDGSSSELKIIGTRVFSGTTYYELSDASASVFGVQNWVTKKGATYFQKTADATINQDGIAITIEGYEVPMFKDNVAANATWSGTVSPKVTYNANGQTVSLTAKVKYTGTLLEKAPTVTLNGETYTDVLKIKTRIEVNIAEQLTVADQEYWFAKDVGPIREYQTVNGETTERTLTDYILN